VHPPQESKLTRMGLVHTPRVLASIAKGLYRQGDKSKNALIGMSLEHPHIYQARAGLFDVDHLGHMNNASYLNHAELARWEMTATNGMLGVMGRQGINFLVTSVALRYRREIRPVFRKFDIESSVVSVDERNLYVYQTFRHSSSTDNKVKAQLLLQGVAVQKGSVLDPRDFLKDTIGVDPNLVDQLDNKHFIANNKSETSDQDGDGSREQKLYGMIQYYERLEQAFRATAADDDKHHS
jgi:acyl-CoA thioesterase FadM